MTRIKYNIELLQKCAIRDKAIIDDSIYKDVKITGRVVITGTCNCGKLFNKVFKQCFIHSMLCRDCTKQHSIESSKQTMLERYGVTHAFQSEQIKNKIKQTMLTRYGVTHALKSKGIKEKLKETNLKRYGTEYRLQSTSIKQKRNQTNLKKYGVENPFQSEQIKKKIKQTNLKKYGVEHALKLKEIQEKQKQTNLKKYGTEYSLQSKEIREKTKQTNIKRYGVENAAQSIQIHKKIQQTSLKRYGVKNPSQSEKIKQKQKQTFLNKYGVEHVLQNIDIAEKASKRAYARKEYRLPSGNILNVQGYEPLALDILLQTYSETEIITSKQYVPELWWTFENDSKQHRHFVDIYIPSKKLCIEVKSTWTFNKNKEEVLVKQDSAKAQGYEYEIWVFNSKKQLIYTIY